MAAQLRADYSGGEADMRGRAKLPGDKLQRADAEDEAGVALPRHPCKFNYTTSCLGLALADAIHLCTAYGAGTGRRGLAVLHRSRRGVLHLPLLPALQTIRFHSLYLPFLPCSGAPASALPFDPRRAWVRRPCPA